MPQELSRMLPPVDQFKDDEAKISRDLLPSDRRQFTLLLDLQRPRPREEYVRLAPHEGSLRVDREWRSHPSLFRLCR